MAIFNSYVSLPEGIICGTSLKFTKKMVIYH